MSGFILEASFVLALVAIAVGAGMIFLPVGLIVGGLLTAATCVLVMRGALREAPRDPG